MSNELIDWFKIHGPIDDFHIYPNISYKLSQNAKSKFEAGYSDTILALIDTTLSKTALNFLAFGLKGIYYHNASYGDQPGFHFISYEEFSNRTLSTPWLHELKLDKGDSLLCCDCSISRKQLVLILKGVSNIVKKYF